jgi:hypothetical protein
MTVWQERFVQLAGVTARQLGLVTAEQALRLGIDGAALAELRDARLLVELDWDVYEVVGGGTGPQLGYPFAAWLALAPDTFRWERPDAANDDAVLSHESACQLHGLGAVPSPAIIFTAPQRLGPLRATRTHLGRLGVDEVQVVDGVPVTTPHRTVLDLIRDFAFHSVVGRVMSDAVRRDLVDLAALHADIVPLAEAHGIPADGPAFLEYFKLDLRPESLSTRNQRALANLRWPDRVALLRAELGRLVADDRLAADVAAEIVARAGD